MDKKFIETFQVCKKDISDLKKLDALKQLAVQKKLFVNARDDSDATPFLCLASHGNLLCMQYVLDKGANISACDHEGFDAKWIANESGAEELLVYLKYYSSKKHSQTDAQYALDADDSSDEEETLLQNELYSLDDNYAAFSWPEPVRDALGQVDPEHYSFLAHAISLNMFYSDEVSKQYYEFKSKLPKTELISSKKELVNWVFDSFKHLLSKVLTKEHPQGKILTNIKDAFLVQNSLWIKEQITSFVATDLRVLLKQLNTDRALNPFILFTVTLQSKLREFIKDFDFDEVDFVHAPYLNSKDFEPRFEQIIRNKLIVWGFLDGTTNKFIGAKTGRNVTIPQKASSLKKEIVKTMKTVTGKSTFKSYYKPELLHVWYQAEIARANNSVICKDNAGYYLKEGITRNDIEVSFLKEFFRDMDEQVINYYLPYQFEDFSNELDNRLVLRDFTSQHFITELKETKSDHYIALNRGLIPQVYIYHSNNFTDFLANVRLSMRIQKRRMRQACDDEQSDKIDGEKFLTGWKFGDNPYLATEEQAISVNGSRTDLVVNLGSYQTIYKDLEDFQTIHAKIADWMIKGVIFNKEALNKELKESQIPSRQHVRCSKFIVNLFYLMVGCEVQRNPASLLTNLITLRLIAESKLTWKKALANPLYANQCGGGLSPMSMGKYKLDEEDKKAIESSPVQCARTLQSRYGLFAIKNLRYDYGPQANESAKSRDLTHITELVKRENRVVKLGLLFNKEKDDKATYKDLSHFIPINN